MNLQSNPHNNSLETIFVDTKKVSCDGLKSQHSHFEGHPLVYLDMGNKDHIVCPYCSRLFTTKNKPAMSINNSLKVS